MSLIGREVYRAEPLVRLLAVAETRDPRPDARVPGSRPAPATPGVGGAVPDRHPVRRTG